MKQIKKMKLIISLSVFASVAIPIAIGIPVGIKVQTDKIINNSIVEIKKAIDSPDFDLLYTQFIKNLYPKQIIERYVPKLDPKNYSLNTPEKVANLDKKYFQNYNKKVEREEQKQKKIINNALYTTKLFLKELLSQPFALKTRLAILSFLNKVNSGQNALAIIEKTIDNPDFSVIVQDFLNGWINSENVVVLKSKENTNTYSLLDLSVKFLKDVFQINFTNQELKTFLIAIKYLLFKTPQVENKQNQVNNQNFLAILFKQINQLNQSQTQENFKTSQVSSPFYTLLSNIFKVALNNDVIKFIILNSSNVFKLLDENQQISFKSSLAKIFQSNAVSKQFHLSLEPQVKEILPDEFKAHSDDVTTVVIEILSNVKTYDFLFDQLLTEVDNNKYVALNTKGILKRLFKENSQIFFNFIANLSSEPEFAPGTLASIAFAKLKPELEKLVKTQ